MEEMYVVTATSNDTGITEVQYLFKSERGASEFCDACDEDEYWVYSYELVEVRP